MKSSVNDFIKPFDNMVQYLTANSIVAQVYNSDYKNFNAVHMVIYRLVKPITALENVEFICKVVSCKRAHGEEFYKNSTNLSNKIISTLSDQKYNTIL